MALPIDSPNPNTTRADTCQPFGLARPGVPAHVPAGVPVR